MNVSGSGARAWGFIVFGAVAAAGIDDDAGVLPGLDEAAAGLGGVVLDDEVVEIAEVFEEGGGVGGDFAQEGGAVDDLAAGLGEDGGEGFEGGGEGGDAGGRDAPVRGSGLGGDGEGDVAHGGGLIDEVAVAEFLEMGLGEIDLTAAVGVAGFAEVGGAGPGDEVGGVFEGVLGEGFFIARAAGGGFGEGCLVWMDW